MFFLSAQRWYGGPVPRTARASAGNLIYHVLNRGNGRAAVFHSDGDYAAFFRLIADASGRVPMRILAACLMPNHFHLVLWPLADGDLSRWMGWLLTAHVRRYRAFRGGSGHVWQGRFKCFPIEEDDEHLYAVLRYTERNALRANLVGRAELWPWGTLAMRQPGAARPPWLSPWPVGEPVDWTQIVNQPETEAELAALRRSALRERPYGSEAWARRTAATLGLVHTMRERGRPRKQKDAGQEVMFE